MPIAVDAMGGDHAPGEVVAGAVQAARELQAPVILVGKEDFLKSELARYPDAGGLVSTWDAPEYIEMGESPGTALRRKPNASIAVAAQLVKRGVARGLVSAGNSGATVGAALMGMGRLAGVAKPAIATVIPLHRGQAILLDVGANVDCRPAQLVQFAVMGTVYARRVLGVDSPRVALLSIGEEPSKGDSRTKAAYKLLKETPLNFVGNVDGKDVFRGEADVVVSDGFVGNVVIKVSEGVVELIAALMAAQPDDVRAQFKAAMEPLRERVDWAEYGGALLLGVNGVCVISHGRSNSKAIARAVKVAQDGINANIVQGLQEAMLQMAPGRSEESSP